MKKMISLLVSVLIVGCAMTALAGGNSNNRGEGDDICWNYVNPFGTDTVRAHFDDTGVTASWIINIGGGTPTPLLIPLTGTIQKDLDGNLRLNLHGNARDLSFASPFIFDCWMDATLDPRTLNSVQIAPSGGSDLHSSVLAGCEGYFDPDNPFTSNDTLTKVSCRQFPNPRIGDSR